MALPQGGVTLQLWLLGDFLQLTIVLGDATVNLLESFQVARSIFLALGGSDKALVRDTVLSSAKPSRRPPTARKKSQM